MPTSLNEFDFGFTYYNRFGDAILINIHNVFIKIETYTDIKSNHLNSKPGSRSPCLLPVRFVVVFFVWRCARALETSMILVKLVNNLQSMRFTI